MGNEASSAYDPNDLDRFDGIDTLGYRVLGVQPNSPASSAGLVSFFDFLVGANGQMLLGSGEDLDEGEEYDDVDFPALLRENIGKEMELLVWNIKSQSQRLVNLTPSNTWGGTGLLGVTIRLDNYAGADERLIRVLSVEHNSPAAIAGLVPMTDYLLGTTMVSFDDDYTLAAVLETHIDRVVELYVYNTESDMVRVVTLMPTLSWGGKGLLGAEVGTGYLHRLPRNCRQTIGSSVERKVRTGARPTEFQDVTQDRGNGAPHHREELVDLTALTDSMAGTAIHMEPQLEMEPEPESESHFQPQAQQPSTQPQLQSQQPQLQSQQPQLQSQQPQLQSQQPRPNPQPQRQPPPMPQPQQQQLQSQQEQPTLNPQPQTQPSKPQPQPVQKDVKVTAGPSTLDQKPQTTAEKEMQQPIIAARAEDNKAEDVSETPAKSEREQQDPAKEGEEKADESWREKSNVKNSSDVPAAAALPAEKPLMYAPGQMSAPASLAISGDTDAASFFARPPPGSPEPGEQRRHVEQRQEQPYSGDQLTSTPADGNGIHNLTYYAPPVGASAGPAGSSGAATAGGPANYSTVPAPPFHGMPAGMAGYSSSNSYSSPFMPPPPMSHLATNQR